MSTNPYSGLQDFVGELPELVQPLLVALIGSVPFIDEAASGLGVVVGLHPMVAFTANVVGSTVTVLLVILLGSRVRDALVVRRARRSASVPAPELMTVPSIAMPSMTGMTDQTPVSAMSDVPRQQESKKEQSKGKKRLAQWRTRYGVPGASLLAPLALPFAFTALFFVGAGVNKTWIMLWQTIAIVVWTAIVTISATAAVAVLGF